MMKERKVKGQSALSRLSGVPQPTIARVLKGTTDTPELGTVKKLAAALGVTSTWLVEGPDEPVEYLVEGSANAAPAAGPATAPEPRDEFAERASVLREMQVAQAASILTGLSDSALSKALGWLQDLKTAESSGQSAPAPAERPLFARKKKVIEFTGLHPTHSGDRRKAK